jgi:hypothetical protein
VHSPQLVFCPTLNPISNVTEVVPSPDSGLSRSTQSASAAAYAPSHCISIMLSDQPLLPGWPFAGTGAKGTLDQEEGPFLMVTINDREHTKVETFETFSHDYVAWLFVCSTSTLQKPNFILFKRDRPSLRPVITQQFPGFPNPMSRGIECQLSVCGKYSRIRYRHTDYRAMPITQITRINF